MIGAKLQKLLSWMENEKTRMPTWGIGQTMSRRHRPSPISIRRSRQLPVGGLLLLEFLATAGRPGVTATCYGKKLWFRMGVGKNVLRHLQHSAEHCLVIPHSETELVPVLSICFRTWHCVSRVETSRGPNFIGTA